MGMGKLPEDFTALVSHLNILKDAEEEAKRIIDDAQRRSDRIINNAEEEAGALLSDAERDTRRLVEELRRSSREETEQKRADQKEMYVAQLEKTRADAESHNEKAVEYLLSMTLETGGDDS